MKTEELKAEVERMNSELTKARELLGKGGNLIQQMAQAIGSNDEYGDFEAEIESAEEFAGEMIIFAHQSAPAAKGYPECGGVPNDCPENEVHGCGCIAGIGAPAAKDGE